MQCPPGQPPPEVLELLVAPALGRANRLGRIQHGLADQLLQPGHDGARAMHRLAVDQQSGDRGVALAVDLLHLLDVPTRHELDALVLKALEAQGCGNRHARMRGR
jgi:hypothetical protein